MEAMILNGFRGGGSGGSDFSDFIRDIFKLLHENIF